jgi:outer membrane protein TolC
MKTLFTVVIAILAWSHLPASSLRAEPVAGKVITLEKAYDMTLSSDQAIGIAYITLQRARLEPLAAWTKLAPQINATTSINGQSTRNRNFNNGFGGGTTGGGGGAAGRFNDAGISMQQPLFDLSFFPARRRGQASYEAARLDYRAKIREILFGVAQAYYDVLSQQRLLAVDKETFRLANEQYDLAQKQAAVGIVTRSDVLRAQVVVESSRRLMVQDGNALESKRNILGNILNLPPDQPFRLSSPPDYPADLPRFAAVLGKALAQREDLRSKDMAIRRDIEGHKQAKAEYAPKIIASVDGGRNDQVADRYQNNWQASVGVTIPIFNGGLRELDVKNAALQIELTKLERAQLEETIEQEVKDAWLNVKMLTETLSALRTQVTAADQSYIDIKNQYEAGASTSVDVLSALNDLNTARKDLAQQTYSLQLALRKLEQVGGTFQQQRVNNAPHQ